ncbi:MAG: 16S rRNA (cytosine(1402)-N(4))-methyltransferase RsmH [Lentisphaeria bacterium]|nr:16S rRNA (cytosine(1402)-N(4))-methyltransferase RsmH [Lentisphaeria bacterium]
MSDFKHISVLPQESIDLLLASRGGRFVDGTLGGAGHSRLILEANADNEILGIDQDREALAAAKKNLESFPGRAHLYHGSFSDMTLFVGQQGWTGVDGILLDIGLSSHQIDSAARGFSFREDGPLDMRMNQRNSLSASTIINQWSESELKRIFKEYGEVKRSGTVARVIVERRAIKPFETTVDLAKVIEENDKVTARKKSAAMLYFQALRIAVNDELGELERALEAAVKLLNPGGRLAIITFHSLEDRMVKKFFKLKSSNCTCPPEFPICICDTKAEVKVINRKVVVAGKDEVSCNSRANCAKLRVIEKI